MNVYLKLTQLEHKITSVTDQIRGSVERRYLFCLRRGTRATVGMVKGRGRSI